ncbi:MAG TPA: penicillin-binding protein 2 [Solirubrobacteraceae bacterium]
MRPQIVRLFGVFVFMFALLIVFTSRWTVLDASSLQNNSLNKLTLIEDLRIKRGQVLADDGTVLARSVRAPAQTWTRTYPQGSLFAQPVGYSIAAQGSAAGLERSDNQYLRGLRGTLGSIFGQLSSHPVGDDVYTTLDPKGQRAAVAALGSQAGSVVALDPRTGAVKVMYSTPSYNPNYIPAHLGACRSPGCSLLNKATGAHYAPGSTFKIVTATAAIDSGLYTPNSVINGNSPITVSGVPLQNDGNQSWGPQTFTTAMINSINTIFAQVAERVGRARLAAYMKRFGFYRLPPLDYPSGEMRPSDVFGSNGKLLPPGSGDEDIGRIGIGEGGVTTTPLQMAMVAAAVANGGKLMTPRLTSRVVNSDGVTLRTIHPSVYSQVMKPSTAHDVTDMMTKVVEEGTGQAVQLSGISVAGKTGTASIGAPGSNLTQPSFVAFAPAQNPKIAIAVTIDLSHGGFGGEVAAPIAKAVLQALLAEAH